MYVADISPFVDNQVKKKNQKETLMNIFFHIIDLYYRTGEEKSSQSW